MSEQIDKALRWGSEQILVCSDSPRLDAELLLAHCLGKPRSYLFSWPEKILEEACWKQFQALVQLRIKPTPVAYLLGSREFYSLEFTTNASALVPRQETELLVEVALQHCRVGQELRILELGTGSGIIAITVKKHRPLCHLLASDIDPACLQLAHANAIHHGVDIEFVESSWFDRIEDGLKFDLILSNPPYIAAHHPFLAQGDLPAEPYIALSPGETGLEALEQIIAGASAYLAERGYLMLEHGYDQQQPVRQLLQKQGFEEVQCLLDSNELPRVSIARLA